LCNLGNLESESWTSGDSNHYRQSVSVIKNLPYQLSHEDASREFNWLDAREDVYTESSSSSIVKFLPALAMSDEFCRNAVLSTLDVADAFLEVPQATPRVEKKMATCWNW